MKGPEPIGFCQNGACCKVTGSTPSKCLDGSGANWLKVSSTFGSRVENLIVMVLPSAVTPASVSASPEIKASDPSIFLKVDCSTGCVTGYLAAAPMDQMMSSVVIGSPSCQVRPSLRVKVKVSPSSLTSYVSAISPPMGVREPSASSTVSKANLFCTQMPRFCHGTSKNCAGPALVYSTPLPAESGSMVQFSTPQL